MYIDEEAYFLSLNPYVQISVEDQTTLISYPTLFTAYRFSDPEKTILYLLNLLSTHMYSPQDLWSSLESQHPTAEQSHFFYFLEQLNQLGLLLYTLKSSNQAFATLEPMASCFVLPTGTIEPDSRFQLSRFAYLHTFENQPILESSLAPARLWLKDITAAMLVYCLSTPQSLSDLTLGFPQLDRQTLAAFLVLFQAAGAIWPVDTDGKIHEQKSASLQNWEFQDLLFHTRCRTGRHNYPIGRIISTDKRKSPIKPTAKRISENFITLIPPDISKFTQDLPFQQVLEKRSSLRDYAEASITLEQLSEFLYRSVRTKQQPETNRPKKLYPGGGGIYELELYITVHRCVGLASGLYYYCPHKHGLDPIAASPNILKFMLQDASRAIKKTNFPDVLLTLTACIDRMNEKYLSIAYATILKDVGVLYQTFYLVATAMSLAPCGIGYGNADKLAEATKLDYYAETSVGEFALGSAT